MTRPPDFNPLRIVVAIPTIPERGTLADETAALWQQHTCQPVQTIIATRPGSWAAGLNEAWEQVRDDPPTVFVCASDDMAPADDLWLPPLLQALDLGLYPAPCVIDPRFTSYGGEHRELVADGTPAGMSSFPVLRGDWLEHVFPLPDDLHYYSDNLIAVLLEHAGVKCVAVPSSQIRHLWAREGRGPGYGDERTRMLVDSVRYTRELDARGIDRDRLPEGQRGGLWEPQYLERGYELERMRR